MWVLMTIYHRLLGRIAERRMEVFRERISVSTATKLSILARGLMMAASNRIVP
jgi:phytoene synthase